MKRSDAFPSLYLKQDDLPRPPATLKVVIHDVRMETMPGGNEATEKPVMYFSDNGTKPMVLNNGNFETIETAYGDESDTWRGKPVELYVDPNVMFGRERTGGIRVRVSTVSDDDDRWTLKQALAACEEGGVSKDDLKEAIAASGHTGWNGKRDTPLAQKLIRQAIRTEYEPEVQQHPPVDDSDIPF